MFLGLISLVVRVPRAHTALGFRMAPTCPCGNNCWHALLLRSLLRQDQNAASCHACLSSTRRLCYLSQAHFALSLWFFLSFCLRFFYW